MFGLRDVIPTETSYIAFVLKWAITHAHVGLVYLQADQVSQWTNVRSSSLSRVGYKKLYMYTYPYLIFFKNRYSIKCT